MTRPHPGIKNQQRGRRSGHGAEMLGRVVPWRDLRAMRRDTHPILALPFPRRSAPRSLPAKMSADFLRRRSGHAAQAPGGLCPPGTERNTPRHVPPIPALPFPRRPAPRSLTAKMSADFLRRRSGQWSVGSRAGYTRRERSAMRRDPVPNRKNVRRLFAEEERPVQRRPPAGYARRERSAIRATRPHSRSPVPSPFRTPFPNRKNVRRLFAEEERAWSVGSRAGYTRRERSAMRRDECRDEDGAY